MEARNLLSQHTTKLVTGITAAPNNGRTVGLVLLLQLTTALTLPFMMSKAITVGSPAFLQAVSAQAIQIRSAVLISMAGSALTVFLGIIMFCKLWRYSLRVAILFLVVCGISCVQDLGHASTIFSMLSISKTYSTTIDPNLEVYKVVGSAVAAARRSAHITQLLAIGCWMFLFYISLLRYQLIPRGLAVLGIVGVMLQFTGVTLMMLLGYPLISQLAMPMLPIHIAVAVWLMLKGFRIRPGSFTDQ